MRSNEPTTRGKGKLSRRSESDDSSGRRYGNFFTEVVIDTRVETLFGNRLEKRDGSPSSKG